MIWAAVLTLANVLADVAIGSPTMVLPQLMAEFGAEEAAWLNASALLAGAIWSPLLARCSDLFGKRRILVLTMLLSCVGALTCYFATHLAVFLTGRFLQGAAFAAVFVTVALVGEIYSPTAAMAVIGIVTSGSAALGIVEPFLMAPLVDVFGHRSIFLAAALLAAVAAVGVRAVIPESPVRGTGRVDVFGALLLGGGLGCVLGGMAGGPIFLPAIGIVALAGWVVSALRIWEPIIDIRALSRPVLLMLLSVVLVAGAFRGMLHLTGVLGGDDIAVLLAGPNLGIVLGGVAAGWIAGRVGPAVALLGGIAIGTAATFGMLIGLTVLPVAIVCGVLMGIAAGAVGASGYNLAISLVAPERHGTTTGLVSVMTALGSVFFTFVGNEVLTAGPRLYVVLAGLVFALAAVPAVRLASFAVRR